MVVYLLLELTLPDENQEILHVFLCGESPRLTAGTKTKINLEALTEIGKENTLVTVKRCVRKLTIRRYFIFKFSSK